MRAIDEILSTGYPCDVELVVDDDDDGSNNNTWRLVEHLQDPRLIVHRHAVNRGKGTALITALYLASGTHAVPFDADLEYLLEDIPRTLEPVLRGRCSVVYGTRLFGCNTVYQSYRYAAGNRLLTCMANLLFNAALSDLHACLKLIPVDMLKGLRLKEFGFGLDTEVTALLLKGGIRPFEVPVSYYSRSRDQGKKITWHDAVACARILIWVRILERPGRLSANDVRPWQAQLSPVPKAAVCAVPVGRAPVSPIILNEREITFEVPKVYAQAADSDS